VITVLPLLLACMGCSVGQGAGEVHSKGLLAHDCWGSPADGGTAVGACFDLQPNFFAAVPFRETLQIRVQRGSDLEEVSDGLSVLVDDVPRVRNAIVASAKDGGADAGAGADGGTDGGSYGMSDGGVIEPVNCAGDDAGPNATDPPACGDAPPPAGMPAFRVAVPVGVVPPGSPSVPPPDLVADPPIVHMALYLQHSCHNQNVILQGVDGWIAFKALFDGDPNETSAADKLTDATFNVEFGDTADTPEGQYVGNVPKGLRSHVCGSFRFYFERGQPGQPFP
jgi:hypothetical protein